MRLKLFLLTALSGIIFFLAWPVNGFPFLLFTAFVPLMIVQHQISADNRLRARHLFLYSFIAFLIWNVTTTWWVACIHYGQEAAYMAFGANSLLMSITFLVYHKVKRSLPERLGSFALIPIWIAFEYLHHDWDLTWPWLTLGNGFASWNSTVQWYEYTGTFGGSFWVLAINVLLFELITHRNTLLRPVKRRLIYLSVLAALIVVPLITSLIIWNNVDPAAGNVTADVVVVQPNIDPYKKFGPQYREHLEGMLAIAETKMDSSVDYVLLPETALVEDFWENQINSAWSVRRIFAYRSNYPDLAFVTGAATGRYYDDQIAPTLTARKFQQQDGWYDSYNTALQFDTSHEIKIYHKSKLVPGSEKLPFPKYLKYLERFALDLGGTKGSLGVQDERTVFTHPKTQTRVAPVICYESIYGDYVSEYVRNGANFIFIMTNDGWWDDTPGYRQHLAYGTLRAIETRKAVARSANTGISCFINTKGEIEDRIDWWQADAIRKVIHSESGMTFYTKHGDYIAQLMVVLAWAGMLWYLVRTIIRYVNARKKA
jgi:apolipoprotein N-acyltransferase